MDQAGWWQAGRQAEQDQRWQAGGQGELSVGGAPGRMGFHWPPAVLRAVAGPDDAGSYIRVCSHTMRTILLTYCTPWQCWADASVGLPLAGCWER